MTPECQALLAAATAKLKAADLLLADGFADDAASRAYYAVSEMKLRIPYTQPSITELEVRYATDAVRAMPALIRS